MYESYFGFNDKPFSITPNPRYLFMSKRHREALAHLLYGVKEGGGFVQLTGEVGTGKTTLCRCLLEQLPENIDIALILNPSLSPFELVAAICDELRIRYDATKASLKSIVDVLNDHLLKVHGEGRKTVVVIDEAQNLTSDVLEQVRLLTNLETEQNKLLQIILVGQPELKKLLAQENMRQVSQRITARYHLTPLSASETKSYIRHRLNVAGVQRPLFSSAALKFITRATMGIPRLINIVCDRALLGAYAKDKPFVDIRIARQASNEILDRNDSLFHFRFNRKIAAAIAASLLLAVLVTALVSYVPQWWSEYQVASLEEGDSNNADIPPVQAAVKTGEQQKEVATAAAISPALPVSEAPVVPLNPAVLSQSELKNAFLDLFAVWGVTYEVTAGKEPCEFAVDTGFRCAFRKGNWNNVRNYNRPVILELHDGAGGRFFVVLLSMSGSTLTLLINSAEYTVSKEALSPYWYGQYTLIWKFPGISEDIIKPGGFGKDVEWLRTRLDKAEGRETVLPASKYFDQILENRVKAFQRTHALQSDGIVGADTLIHLNTATIPDELPLLIDASVSGDE